MNCETIDSIIDDHLVARLTPAERQRAAEHVSACARCSAAWSADDALRAEAIADPPSELFAALSRRVLAEPAQRAAGSRSSWLAGAAAVLVVVAIAARLPMTSIVLERSAPPELSSAPAPAASPLAASPFVAGRDYEVLTTGRLGAPPPTDEVEVIEFFMFECFPCFAAEPELSRWEAGAPSGVVVTHVPALFNPVAQLHARAYYTAEALGKADAMRPAIYDAIHVRDNPLDSRDALADLFQSFGVDRETFDATFDSSDVDARIRRAIALNREYAIQATPTVVVGGRYSTNPLNAATVKLLDYLVGESKACGDRCVEGARER